NPASKRLHFSFENQLTAPFFGDSLRIKIIFHNIINNSIRYQDTEKENSYLDVKVKVIDNQCCIIFQDNGIGISEQSKPRIFEMFYRGTEKADGSGFGLYMVKQAIEKLGGTIECESQEHEGTTFVVKLPIVLAGEEMRLEEVEAPRKG
ncbi:MAG: sensor histidine kinase, partial [Bacteroidia bacterium]